MGLWVKTPALGVACLSLWPAFFLFRLWEVAGEQHGFDVCKEALAVWGEDETVTGEALAGLVEDVAWRAAGINEVPEVFSECAGAFGLEVHFDQFEEYALILFVALVGDAQDGLGFVRALEFEEAAGGGDP